MGRHVTGGLGFSRVNKYNRHTLMVILSGTAWPLSSISRIISTTRWRASGSDSELSRGAEGPSSSGMMIHPFLPPGAGWTAKLNSPVSADLLMVSGWAESPEVRLGLAARDPLPRAGVEHLDPCLDPWRDPCLELSRLALKCLALESSL